MRILEYNDLDTSNVERQYEKLISFLEKDDFQSAEVKKISNGLYRAKLDDSNRLLFKIMTYGGTKHALILEVIKNHAYDKSKFLRGTQVNESKIPISISDLETESLPSLTYVNPSLKRFHLLEKIISFNPEQDEIYRLTAPLIIVGPAGSGKTALTLEKMKCAKGRVLYVTLSRYLAENTRDIYYSNNYENKGQEVSFLSFMEFIESVKIPEGKEITYDVFLKWLLRFPQAQRVSDGHKLYEEFRGVITGFVVDKPWLKREEYLNLGVRQSIYNASERELVYKLFEKYLNFLKENTLYDPNILAHGYLGQVHPTYDLLVADEVQDITNVQLQLILKSLKNPAQFILCGDSNQVVHPNFFSWDNLKSMLYGMDSLDHHKAMRVLVSNFRNALSITHIANRLLRVKQRRLGSIDKESNYLMENISANDGEIVLMKDSMETKRNLNKNIRRSTKYAVLVMRDEYKSFVRDFFDTPLIFSIQEAKGLEYENVILVNFISSEHSIFEEIATGVDPKELQGDLAYSRARDKSDKASQIYKFYINSFYVAITRAVRKLYLIEGDTEHPLIRILGVSGASESVEMDVKESSIAEWQAEAFKLEQQGKMEQAEKIRHEILFRKPVPWDICNPDRVKELLESAFHPTAISQKAKKTLFEYGLFYGEQRLLKALSDHGFDMAKQLNPDNEGYLDYDIFSQRRDELIKRKFQQYSKKNFNEVLLACEAYGIDHRNEFNKTPLMMAALAGNAALIRELLSAGANTDLTDNYGQSAWLSALSEALESSTFAKTSFPEVHKLLMPSTLSLKINDKMIKIDANQGEFILIFFFLAEFRNRINDPFFDMTVPLAATTDIHCMTQDFPGLIPEYRTTPSYISNLLSKNEKNSKYLFSKEIFKRRNHGKYILNPNISIRQKEDWIEIYNHVNIELTVAVSEKGDKHFPEAIQNVFFRDKYNLE